MHWGKGWVVAGGAATLLVFLSVPAAAFDEVETAVSSGENCSFKSMSSEDAATQARAYSDLFQRVRTFTSPAKADRTVAASEIARRNFIDDQIFNQLEQANVAAAPLSSDGEFLRRIYLDLTGRIPTSQEIRDFVADPNPGKRDQIIDKLIDSPEFVDKWTNWIGDLVQLNEPRLSTSAIGMEFDGRNSFYKYLRNAVASGKSWRDMVFEMIAASGNNYADDMGQLNYLVNSNAANGPIQDTYDMMMSRAATAFLGMSHYDCLVCHNGRNHLDQVSAWGRRTTRMEAWRMSAFFSRTRLQRNYGAQAIQYTNPLYNSTDIVDVTTGQYDLNVLNGNRPPRCYNALAVDPTTNRCPPQPNLDAIRITPEYRDGRKPADGNWRFAFAKFLVDDPMFTRNFVNRVWKAMFNLALAEPLDQLDPDRLDPKTAPSAPWSFQATHPELLQKLADHFADYNYSLRETVRIIAKSNAYQLSSRYEGDWSAAHVPLFARHYARRMDGEEIHDAIAKATGNLGRYTIQATRFRESATAPATMLPEPVTWAMQLPDTSEPRSNGAVRTFLDTFLRGNRDTQSRSQTGSILQQLALMNDSFVNNRTRLANSPVLTNISKMTDNDAIVEEMFLTFLSRKPSEREQETALRFLGKATTQAAKNTAIEDMAWALINKVDFIFSY